MAIYAVVTGVELTADEPSPEGRMTGIKRYIPALVPVEEIRVFLKALRKPIEAKAVEDSRVLQVGLSDKCLRWANVVLFLPVDRNLSLRHFRSSILRHACLPGYGVADRSHGHQARGRITPAAVAQNPSPATNTGHPLFPRNRTFNYLEKSGYRCSRLAIGARQLRRSCQVQLQGETVR